jgi:hypothetical protein
MSRTLPSFSRTFRLRSRAGRFQFDRRTASHPRSPAAAPGHYVRIDVLQRDKLVNTESPILSMRSSGWGLGVRCWGLGFWERGQRKQGTATGKNPRFTIYPSPFTILQHPEPRTKQPDVSP